MKIYKDSLGKIYYVGSGLSDGKDWMTLRAKSIGASGHRVVSKNLPIRSTFQEAEADLISYAHIHHLEAIHE